MVGSILIDFIHFLLYRMNEKRRMKDLIFSRRTIESDESRLWNNNYGWVVFQQGKNEVSAGTPYLRAMPIAPIKEISKQPFVGEIVMSPASPSRQGGHREKR